MSDVYYNSRTDCFVEHDGSNCSLVLRESDRVALSKAMSYSLRHDESVGLDSNGWISIKSLITEVSDSICKEVTEQMVRGIVALSDKERYEFKNGEIRALYGHSVNVSVEPDEAEFDPNLTLYHGTPVSNLENILDDGLLPKGRSKVHLTSDIETAFETGQRHASTGEDIVIFSVEPSELNSIVQNPSGDTYTVDRVPSQYLMTYRRVSNKNEL